MSTTQHNASVIIRTYTGGCYDGVQGTVIAEITHDSNLIGVPGYEYNPIMPDGWFRIKLDTAVDIGRGVMVSEDIFSPDEVETLD